MAYCNENNIPLSDGSIGIEALSSDSGYAYASKGGYGNMGSYISYNVAFSAVRKYIHLKGGLNGK